VALERHDRKREKETRPAIKANAIVTVNVIIAAGVLED